MLHHTYSPLQIKALTATKILRLTVLPPQQVQEDLRRGEEHGTYARHCTSQCQRVVLAPAIHTGTLDYFGPQLQLWAGQPVTSTLRPADVLNKRQWQAQPLTNQLKSLQKWEREFSIDFMKTHT
jgi:hypothetical protein